MERFYYYDDISSFLTKDKNEIIGKLTISAQHDINKKTSKSWDEEIDILKSLLINYEKRGSIYFEYNIPRMGKRADVILIIDGIIFVLEFKTGNQNFSKDALVQVWNYALDLKNFQEGSLNRVIVPILIASQTQNNKCNIILSHFDDYVFNPISCNQSLLPKVIDEILESDCVKEKKQLPDEDNNWAKSGYQPTPTIIEAAISLYKNHSVSDITKHSANIEEASQALNKIIDNCRNNKRKAICFITGVPGAGKTLIGLNTAIEQLSKGEKAVYLSGNFPLVEVLQEALSRDYIRQHKDKKTKKEIKSNVKTFIQMIHHYRDLYLEGTKIEDGHIIPIPGYFQTNTDKSYIPIEHIAIFDEAQRAWTKDKLETFMSNKKNKKDFPYSEPEYLISCMDRQIDWGILVCLIGNGQSIYNGESGLKEWIYSINRRYKNWDVYISKEHIIGSDTLNTELINLIKSQIIYCKELHLKMSMRSFRADKVSLFVNKLLEFNKEEAKLILKEIQNYPIFITRSLDTAKQWLRKHNRGSERMGLLASSRAERLKAISINVRYKPNVVNWFLSNNDDIRSSNALEDALTEFDVQGLELDWTCVAWDADMRIRPDGASWGHFQLKGRDKWQNINNTIDQEYQINAYRVLLTRARQGMVILVPEGDNSDSPDTTRNPEWYDGIYNYLKDLGITEI